MNVEDNFTLGYMAYPSSRNKPLPGTDAELHWSRGWCAAQRNENCGELDTQLAFDMELGRDTYASNYVSE